MIRSQQRVGWLSKKFVLQGLVFFQGEKVCGGLEKTPQHRGTNLSLRHQSL